MYGNIHIPDFLEKAHLDQYLANGWFRMGNTISTCNVLNFDRKFYDAIWLRIPLQHYSDDAAYTRLQKKNRGFRKIIRKANITAEKEALFLKYKSGISFQNAASLSALLFDQGESAPFDTHEICLYDNDKLIAAGFFDLGRNSAAGIVSFYDHDYKKYSPGKYLIYSKIEYCAQMNLSYFYPGYFTPNYPVFDYKLEFCKNALQYLDLYDYQWHLFSEYDPSRLPLYVISQRLDDISLLLTAKDVKVYRQKYEYYNANSIAHLQQLELFDYPDFLFASSDPLHLYNLIIVYDIRIQKYKVVSCISYYHNPEYVSLDDYYGEHLMKINKEYFTHQDAGHVANFILGGNLNLENLSGFNFMEDI